MPNPNHDRLGRFATTGSSGAGRSATKRPNITVHGKADALTSFMVSYIDPDGTRHNEHVPAATVDDAHKIARATWGKRRFVIITGEPHEHRHD